MQTNSSKRKQTRKEKAHSRPKPAYDPSADIIRPANLRSAVGFSSTTAWRLRKRDAFPEPIRLTTGAVGWRREDIAAWLESRRVAGGR